MSELLQKQFRFSRGVARLLDYVHLVLNLECTLGEVYRSDEQAEINAMGGAGREALASLIERAFPLLARKIRNNGRAANGIRASLHTERLAIDLNLFDHDGNWIQDSGPYVRAGQFWETLGEDFRAGFRFGDTPHYSIEFDGRR